MMLIAMIVIISVQDNCYYNVACSTCLFSLTWSYLCFLSSTFRLIRSYCLVLMWKPDSLYITHMMSPQIESYSPHLYILLSLIEIISLVGYHDVVLANRDHSPPHTIIYEFLRAAHIVLHSNSLSCNLVYVKYVSP